MHFLKSTSVAGQVLIISCFVAALTVLMPLSARGGAEPDRFDPVLAEKTTLASIKVDTTSGWWSEVVDIPVLIRNDVQIGQFRLEVDFPYQILVFVDVDMGEALSEIGWEHFTYRLEPSDTLYRVVILGTYDIPGGEEGIPLALNSEYVELAVIHFVIIGGLGEYPSGTFFPIWFEWEASDCLENTLQDSTFDTLYTSQDTLQFNYIDCPPESLDFASISPSVEFLDGGLFAFYPPTPFRGDINLNTVPYEVADAVLFLEYLTYGDSVLIDPEAQCISSDVNWDDFCWSMADFIHLVRVILHDAPEVVEPTSQSQHNLDTWISIMRAMPNDTIALPVWCYGWGTEPVYGISFKVDYDPDSLTLIGVDFSATALEDWEIKSIRAEEGWIRLNACPEISSLSDSLPSDEILQVAKLVFVISDVDTPTFISVSFGDDTSSSVQANAFATIDGDLTRLGISNTMDGGIRVGGAIECKRGDINYNLVAYEVADLLLFNDFLFNGPEVLVYDPAVQTCASDVNADDLYWTIADFLYLIRVILHDSPEIPGKAEGGSWQESVSDELRLVSSSAHPGEVISVPIWLSNSFNAWGTTFKLVHDENLLSVEGVDISQTRIEDWEGANPVIDPGELFFFAFSALGPIEPVGYPTIGPGQGVLIKVNFRVDESAPAGTALPITFEINVDWGHYNAYTDSTGLNFVQPTTISGWIYTDVISGDVNSDGVVDAADLVYLINYLYRGKWPPSPLNLGDFNQDGQVNASDVIALLNYLFRN